MFFIVLKEVTWDSSKINVTKIDICILNWNYDNKVPCNPPPQLNAIHIILIYNMSFKREQDTNMFICLGVYITTMEQLLV